MKITIFLIIALFTIAHAEPACDLDSLCMGCDASTADKCTACYNGTNSTYEARYLKDNACANKLTAITDCEYYFPNNTSGTISSSTELHPPCWKCGNSKHLTCTNAVDTNYAGTNAAAVNADTPCTSWTCESTAVTNAAITNCGTTLSIVSTTNAGDAMVCLITAAGYAHNATVTAPGTGVAADQFGTMTNCSTTIATWGTGATDATITCHDAAANYAVKSDGSAGVSYTTDTNCRKLLADDTNCGTCTDGYWFGGAKCYMKSSMIFLSAIAFFAAWFF